MHQNKSLTNIKVLYLFFILGFLSLIGCANQFESNLLQPTPPISAVNNENANFQQLESEADKIDNSKRQESEVQNEKFRQIPDEFKNIDFKNFKYPVGNLKNGELKEDGEKYLGGTTYYFDKVFFLHLNNDNKNEAIVFLSAVSCGGSCDGGRSIVYFYSIKNGKPKLIDSLEMGSRSSGCSLKSFVLKDKKLFVEQFGKCKKEPTFNKDEIPSCKFCIKNQTRTVYHFDKNAKLVLDSIEEIEKPETNVMNYSAEINIDN